MASTETEQLPTFDIPTMGRMTAVEFAAAYNRGEVPDSVMTPGGVMEALPDGRGVRWKEPEIGREQLMICCTFRRPASGAGARSRSGGRSLHRERDKP